jgi:tRNA nucleotidyltransferase (CCA-adding enzyme)
VKAYLVGGAVRDALMGRASTDRDWVVVGSTPEAMARAGFTPVGRDFPVFLHPETKEQYALARTERKTAPGYRGFAFHADPTVTLEEDLARRDLTINAMALDPQGALIDPFNGKSDLEGHVLRHVSAAFSEDPVRILRLARFAARYADFTVAAPTLALARQMVEAGEVDALVPERVWQELARGLLEVRPSRMLSVLTDCGALSRLLPELERSWRARSPMADQSKLSARDHVDRSVDRAAGLGADLPTRFACLTHEINDAPVPSADGTRSSQGTTAAKVALDRLCERLRVPADCRDMAHIVTREYDQVQRCEALEPEAVLGLLERCDALRRPERFEAALLACECIARGWPDTAHRHYPQRRALRSALQRALGVDSTAVAARAIERGLLGPAIGQAIHAARVSAIAQGSDPAAPARHA